VKDLGRVGGIATRGMAAGAAPDRRRGWLLGCLSNPPR
jgi:hypothetical protein